MTPRRSLACLGALFALSMGVLGCSSDASGDSNPRVDPATLPLLDAGQHVGIIYSGATGTGGAALDAAFGECIARGVSTYELSVSWTELESTPGVVDLTYLDSLLAQTEAANLMPYLVIKTIDTGNLNLPSDFVELSDPNVLRTGVSFDSPEVLGRFANVLDQLVPKLVAKGGYYLSVGNEVDAFLGANPGEVAGFAAFVDRARLRAQTMAPELAVGATVTHAGIFTQPTVISAIRDVSDALAFTYYPLDGAFQPLDPSVVSTHMAEMILAASPAPLLLQEVGYPAGWSSGATNGSSLEKQRLFVQNVFIEIGLNPSIRMASFLHLGDYDEAALDTFVIYYGVANPTFREFLGTLGLREQADGSAKPAYTEFLIGLDGL